MTKSRPRGRPSGYDPKFVDEILEYFDIEPYEEKEREVATKTGDVVTIHEDAANDFPSLAGFAVRIGVHRDTLHEWANAKDQNGSLKYPDFSDAYKRAKDFQENYLATNALKGLVNPAFAIFTAKNVLGWRDKQPGEEDKVVVNNNVKVEAVDLEERIKQLKGEG